MNKLYEALNVSILSSLCLVVDPDLNGDFTYKSFQQ